MTKNNTRNSFQLKVAAMAISNKMMAVRVSIVTSPFTLQDLLCNRFNCLKSRSARSFVDL